MLYDMSAGKKVWVTLCMGFGYFWALVGLSWLIGGDLLFGGVFFGVGMFIGFYGHMHLREDPGKDLLIGIATLGVFLVVAMWRAHRGVSHQNTGTTVAATRDELLARYSRGDLSGDGK